jgi:hypothetical protein
MTSGDPGEPCEPVRVADAPGDPPWPGLDGELTGDVPALKGPVAGLVPAGSVDV